MSPYVSQLYSHLPGIRTIRNMVVSKSDKSICFHGAYFLRKSQISRDITDIHYSSGKDTLSFQLDTVVKSGHL